MKILSSEQIRAADQYTIQHEPIASIDLMERASLCCFEKIMELFPHEETFHVFAGNGNNGGDGLVVARLLHEVGKTVHVYIIDFSPNPTPDFSTNLQRLQNLGLTIDAHFDPVKELSPGIVIDALLGSGVTRKIEGRLAKITSSINALHFPVISIDFPSGIFDQGNTDENRASAIRATYTLTFQVPKLAFLMADNFTNVGQWFVLDIGLSAEFIDQQKSIYQTIESDVIRELIHERKPFSHKGTYGHAALVGGSKGKMGAIILSSRACLRSGVGLLSIRAPQCGYEILQTSVPEAMVLSGGGEEFLAGQDDLSSFDAVGIGPGMDRKPESFEYLFSLLKTINKPVVLDADGLNILSEHKSLWNELPDESIITPHPKEFERLFRESNSKSEELHLAVRMAKEHHIIIVLKGRYTAIVSPDQVFFNTTGNPGMATGGSGDVLTGIITSLLAQGYRSVDAAMLGVYIHGFAGDLASSDSSEEAMLASDLVDHLGGAFKALH